MLNIYMYNKQIIYELCQNAVNSQRHCITSRSFTN